MYDLHCHLLPGIDDGARSLDESVALAKMALDDGVQGMVVTPHVHPGRWDNTREAIAATVALVKAALDEAQVPLALAWAGEVRLSDDILSMVAQHQIPFYGEVDGYQLMLLEFPHGHMVPGSDKLVDWLLARGIRPMIAHPERNKAVMREPDLIVPFVDKGCWLQVTANSVTGDFGAPAEQTARWLLERNLVRVVASDAHNQRYRTPALSKAFDAVAERYGATQAEDLFVTQPKAIFSAALHRAEA